MHSYYISSPGNTARILREYGIKLKKSHGQNFLIDTNSAKKIVRCAGVSSEDVVLEIGSGIGSLTQIILTEAKKVVCVEVDELLIRAFKEIFRENLKEGLERPKLELIQADALKLNYADLIDKFSINKVVSNLPYSIAATLLLKILVEAESLEKLFFTIQKDIAERLVTLPGDKNYSSYAVKASFLADFKFCFQIPRNCFIPKPFVDSEVIEAHRKENELLKDPDFDIKNFFDFINACFSHRRKKLINSLSRSGSRYCDKTKLIIELLSGINKKRDVRAEELTLDDYIFLYKELNT
jgi:16S rRNA (adenine1518-N6/adenine1519-N6)-dimethyltransferase